MSPTRADFKALIRLASPIVLVQVGLMLMGAVDTIMVGRVSAEALAAIALANIIAFGTLIFGIGVLLSLDPIISQAIGAGDRGAIERAIQRGIVLSVVLTIPATAALACIEPLLYLVRQPPEIVPVTAGYVYRTMGAVWPFYLFVVLRQTLQAHGCTWPLVVTIIAANLLNAGLNWLWIFGNLGFEPLGAMGSAWATFVSRFFMTGLLLAVGWKHIGPFLRRLAPRTLSLVPLGRMLRLGGPIGGQMMLEWGAFAAISLFMGWLGVTAIAAHQVAVNLASLTFMVPVGISSAAAILVGRAIGSGDADGVRRASRAALIVAVAFMAVMGIAFITLPGFFGRLYTSEPEVLALVAVLLPIAGLFQVFDGTQAVAHGVLRGYGDTRAPMYACIAAFWLLGVPASLVLGFGFELQAVGLWWGFVVGLGTLALFLTLRIRQREKLALSRILIDDDFEDELEDAIDATVDDDFAGEGAVFSAER